MSSSWRIESPKSSTMLAYERLRRAIIAGEFRPGERLTEVAIASLLGVSRTPVREAFARLVMDGLIRAVPPSGMEVVDPRQELQDIYHIREVLEGCAARLAAARGSDAELARIAELARATRDADPSDVDTRADLNRQFHNAIAAASHAPRLERLVSDYREFFVSPRMLRQFTPTETRQAIREHEAITEALTARDADAAEVAIRAHLRRAHTRIVSPIDRVAGDTDADRPVAPRRLQDDSKFS